MPKISIHDVAGGLFVLTLVFVVLFWQLGAPTFWDPDEAHYAETSREMIATGDWWAPHYNEQPFFDKPVLFHQLQALTMRLVRDPELGARLIPALGALGLIAVTVWFGAVVVSFDVGLTAGLILAANPGLFALSRYAILDSLFTFFLFGGCAALALAALRGRRGLQWLGYVALALALLVKGPIALVLAGLTLLMLVAVSSELRARLLALNWISGLALIVAIAAPWFVYMYVRFHDAFVNGYVLDENFRLFAARRFGNQPGYGFYLQILVVGMLPWTGLLVGRLVDDLRTESRGDGPDTVEVMLWVWTIVIVGFFTLSTFKLDHYVFPAAPALCLLCARAWRHPGPAARVGRHLIGPLLVVSGVAVAYLMMVRLSLPPGAGAVPFAMILGGAALTLQMVLHPAPRAPWLAILPMIAVYAGVIVYVMPALEQRKVIPDIASFVASRARPTDRIASYQLNRWTPAYRFYVGRHTTFLDDPRQAVRFFNEPEPFYVVMRRDHYDQLVAQGAPLRVVYEREGMAVTSGRALWRAPEPAVRYVVAVKQQ
jgi:4-amino-4-deoxy-L-arabinose transferase-like glycosyltransferase